MIIFYTRVINDLKCKLRLPLSSLPIFLKDYMLLALIIETLSQLSPHPFQESIQIFQIIFSKQNLRIKLCCHFFYFIQFLSQNVQLIVCIIIT